MRHRGLRVALVREALRNEAAADKVLVWPSNFGVVIPREAHSTASLIRLQRVPVVGDLEFRDTSKSLPPHFGHSSSLNSAILYRRGVVETPGCTNYRRGNGRYSQCVRLPAEDLEAFPAHSLTPFLPPFLPPSLLLHPNPPSSHPHLLRHKPQASSEKLRRSQRR